MDMNLTHVLSLLEAHVLELLDCDSGKHPTEQRELLRSLAALEVKKNMTALRRLLGAFRDYLKAEVVEHDATDDEDVVARVGQLEGLIQYIDTINIPGD
jgi:hypothetical protein